MSDFQQKLTLSVIDKLVFGLLILLAGFVLNRTLENYKSDQATKSEIARLRVERLAKVWTALNFQQAQIDRIDPAAAFNAEMFLTYVVEDKRQGRFTRRDFRKSSRLLKNWGDAEAAFRRHEAGVTRLLRDNRFWIGEDLYPRYLDYSKRQHALVHTYPALRYRLYSRGATNPIRSREALNDALALVRARRNELLQARADVFGVMTRLQ